ncbi:MAG: diaminopropionate ammonia-lyase [Coriobacteriales bacterium]
MDTHIRLVGCECIGDVEAQVAGRRTSLLELFGTGQAERVRAYHRTYPEYAPTSLVDLRHLADHLGLGRLWVKDESSRFGLDAFKVLGGTYCLGNVIARRLERAGVVAEGEPLSLGALLSPRAREATGRLVFATTTDGNHGRGIAWTARRLGQPCVVRMPRGTRPERLENIRRLGADVSISSQNYDETSRALRAEARERGWVLVQDSSWEGYEQMPLWIMQGYLTMGAELVEQLADAGEEGPTHVFLQAGVGSMAAAMAAFLTDAYRDDPPCLVVVEPDRADCVFRTAQAADGMLHEVGGALDSMMAGLACGVPSRLAWEVFGRFVPFYVSMPDYVAATGMRVLGAPLPGDERVVSGESGASAAGLVCELMRDPTCVGLRERLGLDAHSRVLCISTEGATDRENYRRVVWGGAVSREEGGAEGSL